MPANYVLLERIELNASAASVTFANIPQSGYTDLKVVVSARGDDAAAKVNGLFSFNGSTTGFTVRYLGGDGSTPYSNSGSYRFCSFINAAGSTSNTFANNEIYIPNYLSSNNKSWSTDGVTENNATSTEMWMIAGLWSNTAAINSITITPSAGNLIANSTFSLYGLAAVGTTPAIAPKASGGNVIDFDGTYWIHTFTSSGTFTPQVGLTCDYLVVAGGGGGRNGGGGAGGYRTSTGFSAASGTALTVTVGAGGATATNGSNSQFSTISSTAGGSAIAGNQGNSGGSGGGGGDGTSGVGGTGNAGGYTPPEGYNGSNGTTGSGGGGGGALANATIGSTNVGGAGGTGATSSISATSTVYAGGGGGGGSSTGGAGGSGGGGNGQGGGGTAAVNGTTNRGAGGGGGWSGTGAAGGSGIVIIRYLAA